MEGHATMVENCYQNLDQLAEKMEIGSKLNSCDNKVWIFREMETLIRQGVE